MEINSESVSPSLQLIINPSFTVTDVTRIITSNVPLFGLLEQPEMQTTLLHAPNLLDIDVLY